MSIARPAAGPAGRGRTDLRWRSNRNGSGAAPPSASRHRPDTRSASCSFEASTPHAGHILRRDPGKSILTLTIFRLVSILVGADRMKGGSTAGALIGA